MRAIRFCITGKDLSKMCRLSLLALSLMFKVSVSISNLTNWDYSTGTAQCASSLKDTDFDGNDIRPLKRRHVNSFEECCELCAQNTAIGYRRARRFIIHRRDWILKHAYTEQ